MNGRGELRIRVEDTGSRWLVFGRWTLWGADGKPAYESELPLGQGRTKIEALQIAGLFGTATGYLMDRLVKDRAVLAQNGEVFTVVGVATLPEVDQGAGSLALRGERALRLYGQPPCLHGTYGDCDACRQEHEAQLLAMHQAGIDYRGGMVREPYITGSRPIGDLFCVCTRRPADGSHVQACPLYEPKPEGCPTCYGEALDCPDCN